MSHPHRTARIMICPEKDCEEGFIDEDIKTDKGCLREMQALTARCPHGRATSCSWSGPLNELMVCDYCKFIVAEHCTLQY